MELLTAQDLARELKVTVDTVWRYTRTGRIPCVRLGDRDYRYRLADVLASLAAAAAETPAPRPDAGVHARQRLRVTDPGELRVFAGRTGGDG